MLKQWSPLFSAWVKNVYSLRIASGIKRVQTFTATVSGVSYSHGGVYNIRFIPTFILTFYTQLSSLIFVQSPLLISTYAHNPHPLLLRERRKDKKGITIWS